ncbi:MAG: SpoIID/LytB domain-containing protein [Parachlamydiales bacterium]
MFKAVLLGLTTLLLVSTPGWAKEATIKVLIATDLPEAQVRTDGGYRVKNPQTGKTITRSLLSKNYQVLPMATGLKWGEEFPGIYQITIAPRNADQPIIFNGAEYPGVLHIYQVERGLSVVNEVPVEAYVKLLLTNKLQGRPSTEVLSALVIAQRTSAYFDLQKGPTAYWQVRAQEVGYFPRAIPTSIERVAKRTENMVLVSDTAPGKAFPAVWTENCGGKTAPYALLFRKGVAVSLPGVDAPLALRDKGASAWNYTLSKGDLAAAASLNSISHINLFTDPHSGKVYSVRLFDGERWRDFDYFTFQKLVGSEHLVSSDFSVTVEEDQVHFHGYGEGHGVGLCLHSAEEMAKRGQNARDILKAFFPTTQIEVVSGETAALQPRRGSQPSLIRRSL